MSFDCTESKDVGFRNQSLMHFKNPSVQCLPARKKAAFHVIPAFQAKAARIVDLGEINHWS